MHILGNFFFCISMKISLMFVPNSPTDSKSSLVHVMVWHLTGDKPMTEPMITLISDIYASPGLSGLNIWEMHNTGGGNWIIVLVIYGDLVTCFSRTLFFYWFRLR